MKISFITILFFYFSISFKTTGKCFLQIDSNKYYVHVFLRLGECSGCSKDINLLNSISYSLKPKLIFPKQDDKKYNYIKKCMNLKWNKENCIFSDSLYANYEYFIQSTVIVLKNNKIVYTSSLRDIRINLDYINSYSNNEIIKEVIRLPKNIVLSSSVSLKFCGNNFEKFIVFDQSFGNIYKFYTNKKSQIRHFDKFSKEKLSLFDIYNARFHDTTGYDNFLNQYKILSKQYHNFWDITGFSLDKDTVLINIIFYWPSINDNTKEVTLNGENYVIKWYNNKILNYIHINNPFITGYAIFSNNLFFKHNNNYYFSMIKFENKDSNYYHFASFRELNGSLYIDSFLQLNLPDFFLKTKLYYNLSNKYIINDIVFFSTTPSIIFIENMKQTTLKIQDYWNSNNTVNIKSRFYLYSVFKQNETIIAFYMLDSILHKSWFSLDGTTLKTQDIMTIDNKNRNSSYSFLDISTFGSINTTLNQLTIYHIQ